MEGFIFVALVLAIIFFRLWMIYGRSNILTIDFNPHTELFKNRLRIDQVNTLFRYSAYYRLLPEKLKAYFEHRIVKFMEEKEFIVKGDLTLTEDMKLLVADSAVKLTFGLRNYLFEKFEKIIIFKGEFYSEFSKSQNKGETNPAGAIVFSWKDLLEGDANTTDGINLGLHEFAHALLIQNLGPNGMDEEQVMNNIDEYESFYNNENNLSFARSHHLFRDYGFRNKMEFFAVAIEQFFEVPDKLKSGLPELYDILSSMLNQNPLVLYTEETGHRRQE